MKAGANAVDSIVRTPSAFGAVLRRARRKLGISQGELGERINLRQATISALEAGAVDAKLSTLMDVIVALGLELVIRPRSTATNDDIEAMF
jgi:HTH-type transcriptional regulator/antitoxin HipB